MIQPDDPALYASLLWYSVGIYPVIERLGFEGFKPIAESADGALLLHPLMRDKKGNFPEVELPEFGKKSIVFCTAVVSAFLVYSQRSVGIDELPNSPLLKAANDGYNLWKLENRPDELPNRDTENTSHSKSRRRNRSNTDISNKRTPKRKKVTKNVKK